MRIASSPPTFVTTEDGTGLVHLAPAFGCRRPGHQPRPRAPRGQPGRARRPVQPGHPAGRRHVLQGRRRSGSSPTSPTAAWRSASRAHEHSYPHCWRCHTRLLYYALPSWYIKTTAVKDQLLEQNELTNWYPPTIKHGRYGEWLRNNVDWALSRSRYWGTPLPLWECPDGHVTCVSSLAELASHAGRDLSGLDPHRPYVDEVTITCPAVRARGAPGARGHRRLVRLRFDAVRAVGRSAHEHGTSSRRRTRPSTSARRSTRPVAGSTP